MRAREFIYEDKKRIDEVPAIPIGKAISGVATAGFVGYQAYETWNDFQKFNNSAKTQADVDELVDAVGEDLFYIAAGLGIGYAAGKTAQFVGKVIPIKKGMEGIRQIYRAKRAASAARKAQELKNKAQQLSTTTGASPYNLRLARKAAQRAQDKANELAKKAGIPTGTPITAPGYNVTGTTVTSKGVQQTSKGAQQPVKKKPETEKPETKKTDKDADVSVPTAVTTAGATKFIPEPVKKKIGDFIKKPFKKSKKKDNDKNGVPPKTTGAAAAKVAQKSKSKLGYRGAVAGGLAAKAIQKALDFDKDETAADRKAEFDKLKGQVVYTGFEKDPPVKRFDAGGLGTKFPIRGERPKTIDSKTMAKNDDSSSTVGSKTPKLPKQNKDPLSQQKAK